MSIEKKLMLIVCGLFAVLYSFCYSHSDCQWICKWGYYLIDVIRTGNLGDYAQICWDNNAPNNYMILSSAITAIWELPLYVFDHIMGRDPGGEFVYYTAWYKILIMIVTGLSLNLLRRIMLRLGASDERIWVVCICYLISPIFLMGALAKGQMDSLANFFLLLSFNYAYEKRYYHMAFSASMLVVLKGIGILFFIPVILLLFSKSLVSLIRYGLCIVSLPALSRLIEAVLFPKLHEYAYYMDTNVWNHVYVLFDHKIGNLSVFLLFSMVIYILAFIRGLGKEIDEREIVLYPAFFCLVFLGLMPWSLWWSVYAMLFIGVASIIIDNDRLFVILFAVFSLGIWMYAVLYTGGDIDCMMLKGSLFEHFFPIDWPKSYLLAELRMASPKWADYYEYMPQPVFTAALVSVPVIGLMKKAHDCGDIIVSRHYQFLAGILIITMDAVFLIYTFYYCYFKFI